MPQTLTNPSDIFPSATADGKQIRYDIARPLYVQELYVATGGNAVYEIKDTNNIICIYAPVLTAVVFDIDTLVLQNVQGLVLAPEERALFMVPQDTKTLYCRAITNAGTIYIHEFAAWHGLTTQQSLQYGGY